MQLHHDFPPLPIGRCGCVFLVVFLLLCVVFFHLLSDIILSKNVVLSVRLHVAVGKKDHFSFP